jgi:hypothetical protein
MDKPEQVVCIVDEWDPPEDGIEVPPFAPKYRDVLTVTRRDAAHFFFAELPEIYRLPDGRVGRVSWPADAFRPLITFERDISIFAPPLDRQRQPEVA